MSGDLLWPRNQAVSTGDQASLATRLLSMWLRVFVKPRVATAERARARMAKPKGDPDRGRRRLPRLPLAPVSEARTAIDSILRVVAEATPTR